ncbi:transglutaminase family protein [Okibacterium endophyticum]
MHRTVSSHLVFDVIGTSELIFSMAVAAGTPILSETYSFRGPRDYVATELHDRHGVRLHRFVADAGRYDVHYHAVVAGTRPALPHDPLDGIRYLRPSRYCESDVLHSRARALFGTLHGSELLRAVTGWTHENIRYVPGSSSGTDTAVSTIESGSGVCRDFAHVVIAMLRACGVPARMVSAYAPGLKPMDFHAVAEAFVDGIWQVVDATGLAPRQALVRIATGRDASDIAFLTNHGGSLSLDRIDVGAVADLLPADDHLVPVIIG